MVDVNRMYTVEDVATLLGVHEQTVREWLRAGRLDGKLLSRKSGWRIPGTDVLRFLEADTDEGKAIAA